MKLAARSPAAARPRPDAADRGPAGGRPAAPAGPARPARTSRSWRRPAMRSSPTSACCSRPASPSGLARDNNGAAGLAGVVCFLIATEGAETLLHVPPDALAGMAERRRRPRQGRLQGQGHRQARRADRHPLRAGGGHALQPVLDDQAAGLPGLLRRAAVRADRRGLAGLVLAALGRLAPTRRSAAASTRSAAAIVGSGRRRAVRLRRRSTGC